MNTLIVFFISHYLLVGAHNLKGFDDTILFDIKWPGALETLTLDEDDTEHVIVTTAFKEQYKCYLPNVQSKEDSNIDNYNGLTPFEIITPLFHQTTCSYRLEPYWTYEVCHGRFIRQYHEDREGKKVKIQEYYLGRWDKGYPPLLVEHLRKLEKETSKPPIPVKKIDGFSLPYFEITMGNGTLCELNQNRPRETKVVYVCYVHGKHEIYSLKETSTCVYEVIVLSPLLCAHPRYKPLQTGENHINCQPLEGHPPKPRNLLKMTGESKRMRTKSDDHFRVEFHPIDVGGDKEELVKMETSTTPTDTSPVASFLAGERCLNGGTGWWKYEFCYGKSVEQYHIEKNGKRTSINLGVFDRETHLAWLEAHPHKRPKPLEERNQLSHFYAGGTVCDKTGKARQTEVKLKCLDGARANINAVSLYLLEPRYCEYILGVESPLICDILARADGDGLVGALEDEGESEEPRETVTIIKV